MKISEREKVNNNRYDISSMSVTRKFLEVSTAKKCTKKVCCKCKVVVFLLIRPIVVFSPFSLPSPLSIT